MPPSTRAGKILVLHGPSSAGKSTLARAVREARPGVAVVSVDQLYKSLTPPVDRPAYVALTLAAFAAAASLAASGHDVLVDVVFAWPECIDAAREANCFVALTAPLEVLLERERARGDRPIGLAQEQVYRSGRSDLTIATTEPVEESVVRVLALLDRPSG